MNPASYKGIYLLAMYDYIKENSDIDHHLTVGDIANGIQSYFGSASPESIRRSVIRHIDELLIYDEHHVNVCKANGDRYHPGDGSPGKGCEIWYESDFTEIDIQFLSDAVVYSTHMNREDRIELLDKITALKFPHRSGKWARTIYKEAEELASVSPDMFLKLEWINYAIAEQKCIDFKLNQYGWDKNLHPQKSVSCFSPYRLYLKEGVYCVTGVTGEVKELVERHHAAHPDSKAPYVINTFEIFRISEIRESQEQSYLPIQRTPWADKTLEEIMYAGFSIYGEYIDGKHWGMRSVLLYVNDAGLDALVRTFGSKCMVHKAKNEEYHELFYVAEGRSDNVYRVEFDFLNIEEKAKLIEILSRYPTRDIRFISPKEELEIIVRRLNRHL